MLLKKITRELHELKLVKTYKIQNIKVEHNHIDSEQ